MATSKATTVTAYLASLPEDRRAEISAVRDVVRKSLPRGFEESMQYGMISWVIPLSRFSDTYNGQALGTAALAAQKNYCALYLLGAYSIPEAPERLAKECREKGTKLDMGKSCIRFKAAGDLPLKAIGEIISTSTVDWVIDQHEAAHASRRAAGKIRKPAAKAKTPAPRSAPKTAKKKR